MATKVINFGTDEFFISKYKELKSSRKMGEFFGCEKTTILNHCKKIGFDPKSLQSPKLTEKQKQEIISLYEEKTASELAKVYNVSDSLISKVWMEAGKRGKKRVGWCHDLTGQTFGYLTVIEKTDKRGPSGGIVWKCSCNCGLPSCLKEKDILGATLLEGKVISCGAVGKKNLEKGREVKNLVGQKFGHLTVIKRAENKIFPSGYSASQWLCKCDCGNETIILGSNLTSGNSQSCIYCKKSHGENKIEELLKENELPFTREQRFDTCKNVRPLPFDFYVNNQYLIEFDGKQHFEATGERFNEEVVKDIQKRDSIKNQWCKENNIPLIRIPYSHYNDLKIEDLLLETTTFLVNNADIKSRN